MKKKGILLLGMAGVGKSTTGKLLSQFLNYPCIDLDNIIIQQSGKPTQKIIDEDGESHLLALERSALESCEYNNTIIAPGGSIVYQMDLMEQVREKMIMVYLEDRFENIERREKQRGIGGVIGMKDKTFHEVFLERESLYKKFSHIQISVEGKSPEEVVQNILQAI